MTDAQHGSQATPVAIITGAGKGIGAGMADFLAEQGYAIAIWEIDEEAGQRKVAELHSAGRAAISLKVDVSDHNEVLQATAQTERHFGRVDALINNAMVVKRGRLETLALEDWNATLATGLNGAFYCSQCVGKIMIRQRKGAIVNIASISATGPQPVHGSYSACKAGLLALTKQLAVEWGPHGIRCNAISPGFTISAETAQYYGRQDLLERRGALVPLGRIGTADDVAKAAAFLISDNASYVTGLNLIVDGGLTLTLIDRNPGVMPSGEITDLAFSQWWPR